MDYLAKEINARPHLQDSFDFSEISPRPRSNLGRAGAKLHSGEVGYFKDETKGDPIVEFVGLRPKMYSFTVCEAFKLILGLNYPMDVRHKAVAKGVAGSQIKRFKRGLCPYDDKRYLLAELPDGRPNPNTHAYGHCDLAADEHLIADQPETGAKLIIRHPEERFARRHARVTT